MFEFIALAYECAPNVAFETLSAIVKIESSYNPYAIGVVGGQLERQPKTRAEAVATANMLHKFGYNFSMGLAQVNLKNLPHYNATIETIFDPCVNLKTGGLILEECYVRAANKSNEQTAVRQALSCYYSGNFIRGFKPDSPNMPSYVEQVVKVALSNKPTVPKILHYTLADREAKNEEIANPVQLKNARVTRANVPLNKPPAIAKPNSQAFTNIQSSAPVSAPDKDNQPKAVDQQNMMIQTTRPDDKVVF